MQLARYAVVASLLAATPAMAGPSTPAPIIGGTPTAVGDYPSTVAISVGGGLCTATLLTPEWVLTAAHCVSPSLIGMSQDRITEGLRVYVGTVNLGASLGTTLRASATIPHPDFSLDSLGAHDIGLVKLQTPFTGVAPVPVNLIASRAPIGIGLTMVGFGVTMPRGNQAGVEYVVQQTSVSCENDGDDQNLICFDQTSGRGKCEGDSGGPSFATIAGKQVQVGVTSFGDQDCAFFGADTRIDAERDFLAAHVAAIKCGDDGACTGGCGFGALPIDPDCTRCTTDDDCPGSGICFQHQCMTAPFAPSGLGSACTGGGECETGQCASKDDEQRCVLSCTRDQAGSCPDGFECAAAGDGGGACWPAADGGCCDAGQRGAPTAWLSAIVIGLALGRRRRRSPSRR